MQKFLKTSREGIEFQIGIPDYPQSLWIDHYFAAKGEPSFNERRVFPNNQADLFFNLGCLNKGALNSDLFAFKDSLVSGLRTNYMTVMPTGNFHIIGMRFTLFGFSDMWKIPAREIFNGNFSAADVLGNDITEVHDKLLHCSDLSTKFSVLENWINTKIKSNPEDFLVWNNIERKFRQPGFRSRSQLSTTLGYSYKHAVKLVVDKTGIAPKMIERIYRINKVLKDIGLSDSYQWGNLAYSHGFSDQSHMIRELKAFTGFTPDQLTSQSRISTDNALRILR